MRIKQYHFFLLLLLLLLIHTFYHLPSTSSNSIITQLDDINYPINIINNNDTTTAITTFIRTSCDVTLYPDLCFTSLSSYSNSIQYNHNALTRAAIAMSLVKAHRMALYIFNLPLQHNYNANSRTTFALSDCFNYLGEAIDDIRSSLKQMHHMINNAHNDEHRDDRNKGNSKQLVLRMSNARTSMNTALRKEEMCTNGFENVKDDDDNDVKKNVCDRMVYVKKFTSNALALLNSYINKGMP